jgi:hypothetical protein
VPVAAQAAGAAANVTGAVTVLVPATARQAAGCRSAQGAATQRPSAPCRVQFPAPKLFSLSLLCRARG